MYAPISAIGHCVRAWWHAPDKALFSWTEPILKMSKGFRLPTKLLTISATTGYHGNGHWQHWATKSPMCWMAWRPPSAENDLLGSCGVRVGVFTHLMERGTDGVVDTISVLAAEDAADRLALELLAPRNEVLARLNAAGTEWKAPAAFEKAAELLRDEFGLPLLAAERYSDVLVLSRRPSRSFREWLES